MPHQLLLVLLSVYVSLMKLESAGSVSPIWYISVTLRQWLLVLVSHWRMYERGLIHGKEDDFPYGFTRGRERLWWGQLMDCLIYCIFLRTTSILSYWYFLCSQSSDSDSEKRILRPQIFHKWISNVSFPDLVCPSAAHPLPSHRESKWSLIFDLSFYYSFTLYSISFMEPLFLREDHQ